MKQYKFSVEDEQNQLFLDSFSGDQEKALDYLQKLVSSRVDLQKKTQEQQSNIKVEIMEEPNV